MRSEWSVNVLQAMIDKAQLISSDVLKKALDAGQKPFVGIDVAVNAQKGLRLVARVNEGLWERTLRFGREFRLQPEWPYLDLERIAIGNAAQSSAALPVEQVFRLSKSDADILSRCLAAAAVVAVDAPRGLATGDSRRSSEDAWHQVVIPGLKERIGGVIWSPFDHELTDALTAYFSESPTARCTTTQLQLIAGSQWMFVGFWIYEQLQACGCPFFEFFPAAARTICCEVCQSSSKRATLLSLCEKWSSGVAFNAFCKNKSETNDAAMGSFLGYLHQNQLTMELAPNEIVIPRRGADSCW